MNRKVLIGVAVAAVLIIGGVSFLAFNSSEESAESGSQSTTTESANTETAPTFNPNPTSNQSFEATLTGSTGGSEIKATILYDGQGNAKYSGESAGQTFEAYLSKGDYIACSGSQCVKIAGTSQQIIDVDQFSYSQDDYNKFKDTATYEGKQDCPAGSCETWKITQSETTTKIYIDGEGRVNQLKTESPEGAFTYTYEYKDVAITLPKNVQTLPTQPVTTP